MYIYGPVDIDTIASSNTFSDLANETVIIYRQWVVSISSSWLVNLTANEVSKVYMDYSSIDGSDTVDLYGNDYGGEKKYYTVQHPFVAKFNASGINVLYALKYTLRIVLTNGDEMSYKGTFALGATGPLEMRLE
jgi:hypothetical protein